MRGALGRALGAAGRRQAPMRGADPILCGHFLSEPPLPTHAHPVPTLPGHIAATLSAREIRVSDLHLAGPGPIDAESAGASIPTFTSASRSREGNRGEDELCCPPYPSFLYYIREKEGKSYQLKGGVWPGRAGSLGAPHKPSHFRRRLTLTVSYRKQPSHLTLTLP